MAYYKGFLIDFNSAENSYKVMRDLRLFLTASRCSYPLRPPDLSSLN
jgi:hypothetical protein